MNKLPTLILLLLATQSSIVYADNQRLGASQKPLLLVDEKMQAIDYSYKNNSEDMALTTIDDDWIKTTPHYIDTSKSNFSISKRDDFSLGKKVDFAWNISNFLSLNLSVFENQARYSTNTNPNRLFQHPSYGKVIAASSLVANDTYRNLKGYSFGLSSEVDLWQNYKLDINFDYGLLDGADLVGFNHNAINTTSFALGIRKAKFGASVNTDIFLQDNVDYIDSSRLGIELDWHFTDDSKISIGTKQRLNNSSTTSSNPNSLDAITGNVQYIKFEHSL